MIPEVVTIPVNERIVIRSWQEGDENDLVKNADNVKIAENIRDIFPSPYTYKDAEQWVQFAISEIPQQHFAIEVENEASGGIGLKLYPDVYRKNIEIGYWLGENHWNKGVMTICLKVFTKWIFENFNNHRIFASVFSTNYASMKALENAGFNKEAILKESIYKKGKYLNEYIYVMFE